MMILCDHEMNKGEARQWLVVIVYLLSITKCRESDSVQALNKQNQVNNSMNLIYLKQYFSPFSN